MQLDLVAAIHRTPNLGVFCVSGGGAAAIEQLLSAPGASKTVLECVVPYSTSAMQSYLGRAPSSAVSSDTAAQMAMTAYQRANRLNQETAATNFGLSCTAALATDRSRRGADRAYIGLQSLESTLVQTLEFRADLVQEFSDQAQRALRRTQEDALSRAIMMLLADFLHLTLPNDASGTEPYSTSIQRIDAPPSWQKVMAQTEGSVRVPEHPICLFPGAFNPPHDGHIQIKDLAGQTTGRTTYFELSIHNVDKPSLDYLEIKKRLDALESSGPVLLTNAPTFIEKARLFPGAIFAVGVDTLERIDAPRYYDSIEARDAATEELIALNVTFLVFGRLMGERFVTLEDLVLSPNLKPLCHPMSEQRFRADISSSSIRTHAKPK